MAPVIAIDMAQRKEEHWQETWTLHAPTPCRNISQKTRMMCGWGFDVTGEVHTALCSPQLTDLYDISMQLERWLYPRQGQPESLTLMQAEWESERGNQWGNKWRDGAARLSLTLPLSRGSSTDFQTGRAIKNTCLNGPRSYQNYIEKRFHSGWKHVNCPAIQGCAWKEIVPPSSCSLWDFGLNAGPLCSTQWTTNQYSRPMMWWNTRLHASIVALGNTLN